MKEPSRQDPIRRTQLRTVQYDHVDGTPELSFGCLYLLIAMLLFLFAKIPGLSGSSFSTWIFMLVLGGGGILIGRLAQLLKERLTYPRSGYLAYQRQGRPIKRSTRLLIWIGVPLSTVVLLVLLFLNRQSFPVQGVETLPPWLPGIAGLLFSGLWVIAGWKLALPRYFLIAAATFLTGAALLFSGLDGNLGMGLLFGAMSLSFFASGGVTLWKYLRRNPVPQELPDVR